MLLCTRKACAMRQAAYNIYIYIYKTAEATAISRAYESSDLVAMKRKIHIFTRRI